MSTKHDIYEHLAEIYLDASYKTKKKSRASRFRLKNLVFIGIAVISAPTIYLFAALNRPVVTPSNAFVVQPQIEQLQFSPNQEQNETYSINLDRRDLRRYKTLAFSVRKDEQHTGNLMLRVRLTSSLKQTSEIYIKSVSYKWEDVTMNLKDFSNISDWSRILNLSFIPEEPRPAQSWKNKSDGGTVYINNVRFLR